MFCLNVNHWNIIIIINITFIINNKQLRVYRLFCCFCRAPKPPNDEVVSWRQSLKKLLECKSKTMYSSLLSLSTTIDTVDWYCWYSPTKTCAGKWYQYKPKVIGTGGTSWLSLYIFCLVSIRVSSPAVIYIKQLVWVMQFAVCLCSQKTNEKWYTCMAL